MEYYCSKCLVNKVEYDGGVCAVCGGDSTPERNYSSECGPVTSGGTVISSGRPVVQNNFNSGQGNVNITSHRRLIGGQQPLSNKAQNSCDNNTAVNKAVSNPKTPPKPKKITSCSGVIQNFTTGPDERSFLNRIIDSLFLGISYNGRNNLFMTEFQLYENWNSGYGNNSSSPQATRVVYYGKVGQGRPVENNDVNVYGTYDTKNNYFIAESIMNQTDGTYANFIPRKIPASLIRMGFIGILLAIFYVVFLVIFGGGSGIVAGASDGGVGVRQILFGLLTIVIGVGVIFFSRSGRRKTQVGAIIAGISLALVGIFIMTIRNFEEKAAVFMNAVVTVAITAFMLRFVVSCLINAVFNVQSARIEKMLNGAAITFSIIYIILEAVNIFFV